MDDRKLQHNFENLLHYNCESDLIFSQIVHIKIKT